VFLEFVAESLPVSKQGQRVSAIPVTRTVCRGWCARSSDTAVGSGGPPCFSRATE